MSDVDAEGVPDALVPDPTPDEVPSMGGPAAAADPAEGHGSEEATEVVSARTGPAPSVADSTPVLAPSTAYAVFGALILGCGGSALAVREERFALGRGGYNLAMSPEQD